MLNLKVTCPTAPTGPDGKPHTIQGCGSSNVTWDGDVFDCLDCGIFFNAAEAVWDRRYHENICNAADDLESISGVDCVAENF